MEQRRGSHRAAVVNAHSIATDSMDSPRKGRKWSLTSTGSPEQEKETTNNNRGFRLLSPKKALQLKKQAKARKRQEKEQKLESCEGGSGNLMPIWEKVPQNRGTVAPPRRTEMCAKLDQLNRIEDPSEGSVQSVGMDELFEAAQNGVDLSTSNARMHSTSPTRMQSGPQPTKLNHLSPRRSVSDERDYQLPGESHRSVNFMDLSNQPDMIIPPTSPLSRASSGVHSQRAIPLARQTRSLSNQRSATGCEPIERCLSNQPDMMPPTSPLSRASSAPGVHSHRANTLPRQTRRLDHLRRAGCEPTDRQDGLSILVPGSPKRRSQLQNSKPQRRDDFHQSLNFMDIFDDTEQDAGGPPANCADAVAAQEEEMMAMALEQSIRDVGGLSVPMSPQSRRRNSLEKSKYGKSEPEFERVVLRKSQDWKTKYKTKRDTLSTVATNTRTQDADAEAVRIAEEEQEKEMIQLAMERSMADFPTYSPPPRPSIHQRRVPANPPVQRSHDHRPTAPVHRIDADSEELERREQEMMARALEMSRNDF